MVETKKHTAPHNLKQKKVGKILKFHDSLFFLCFSGCPDFQFFGENFRWYFLFPRMDLGHLSGPRDEVVEKELVVVLVSVVPVEEEIDVLEEVLAFKKGIF